jgi:hypothetical protein
MVFKIVVQWLKICSLNIDVKAWFQLWFQNFLRKMPLGTVGNFPLDFFKPFGWLGENMIRWYQKEHHTLIFQDPLNFGKNRKHIKKLLNTLIKLYRF